MRALILVALFFPALSEACPDLFGNYVCDDGSKLSFTQSVENGVTIFSLWGQKIIADQSVHDYPADLCFQYAKSQAWCDAEDRLTVSVRGRDESRFCGGPGDVSADFHFSKEGQNIRLAVNQVVTKKIGPVDYQAVRLCKPVVGKELSPRSMAPELDH